MSTNPKDFIKLLEQLPENVKENVWFIPLKKDEKIPDAKGQLKDNPHYRLSPQMAYERLCRQWNVGIYARPNGLMFLDLDVKLGDYIASKELISEIVLSDTLTVMSRNGGIQLYFLNDGRYKNQLVYEGEKVIGELRTNWFYVCSVGSFVPTDEHATHDGYGAYKIIHNTTIKSFDKCSKLFENLQLANESTTTEKRKSTRGKRTIKCLSNEEHDIEISGCNKEVWE